MLDTGVDVQVIDSVSTGLLASGTTILAYHEGWSAYDRDGRRRYDIELAGNDWLSVAGNRGYVCDQRSAVAVIDLGSGQRTPAGAGRACPTLFVGRASGVLDGMDSRRRGSP